MQNMKFSSLAGRTAAVATVVLGLSAVAGANVLFSTQGTLPPPREEVQFNDPDLVLNGMLLEGITNQSNAIIEFTGEESLLAQGLGQAGIIAEDGGFDALTIEPADDLLVFTGIGFNLFAVEDGSVTITAHTVGGSASETFDLRRNGQNRFNVTTDHGDLLHRLDIATTVDLSDARQVRLQGLTVIPEPGSLALLGAGGLLALRRRR